MHDVLTNGVLSLVNNNHRLDRFHQFVLDNGWSKISDIYVQPWGAKECSLTTIDGSVIRFFETTV